jgi:hypothetical protein
MSRTLPALSSLLLLLLALPPTPAAEDEEAERRAADEKLLRQAGFDTDGPGLLAYFRKRTPTAEDTARMEKLVRQLGSEKFDEREAATKELHTWGETAAPALRKAAQDEDVEVSRRARELIDEAENGTAALLPAAAARLLAHRAPPGAVAALLAYLPHAADTGEQNAPYVEEAVRDALAALAVRPGPPDPALAKALKDPLPLRRGAAAYALGRRTDEASRAAVRELLADKDSRVRLRAAQGLLAGGDGKAVPALVELATGEPGEISWHAEDLLARLAGDKPPDLPAGDDTDARRSRRRAWLTWWEENGKTIDVAKAAERPAVLGLTLVPEMHANKVWECRADGKPLWELAVPNCPIDAQVLPGGRVLVAELNGGQVSERDLKGNVLWKHAVDTPIACQRLPNGTTWISTNHRWFIVTPEGKEVTTYTPENGFFIHSVQRQRNGHVVCVSMEGTVREVDAEGKLVRDVPLPTRGGWSGVEAAPGGRYLAVNNSEGKVLEVDAAGKVVWEYQLGGACYAQRLTNGNTLVVSNSTGLVEVDRKGNTVWERKMPTSLWRAHRR